MQNLFSAPGKAAGQTLPPGGMRVYGIAVLSLAMTFGIRWMLDPFWGDHYPFIVFFAAIYLVIQLGDFQHFLFTLLLGFLLGDWFFTTPRHSLWITGGSNRISAAVFFVVGFMVWFFTARIRQALFRERCAREELFKQTEACVQLAAIVESSEDAIIGKSLDGNIVSWNRGAEKLYGYTADEAVGRPLEIVTPPERCDEMIALLERVGHGERVTYFETVRHAKDGHQVEVSLSISPVCSQAGKIVGVSTIARDISARKQAEREQEKLLRDLQGAVAQIKTLSGLLPICMHCKRIRDDKGYWNQLELYIHQHSNAEFSHGICPECSKKLYPELFPE